MIIPVLELILGVPVIEEFNGIELEDCPEQNPPTQVLKAHWLSIVHPA
jgi:hypothetical protein